MVKTGKPIFQKPKAVMKMREFLLVVSDVAYVFFVISAIVFGVSVAVKLLLIKTVKKISRESDKNFDNIEDNEEKSAVLKTIEDLTLRYSKYQEEASKNKKLNRKNTVRKSLKISTYSVSEAEDNLKEIYLSLFKDISCCFEGSGGYLNLSKNEILTMLRALADRTQKILSSSDIIWLKTIKIPFYIEVVKLYTSIEKFKSKPSVILITYFIDFCLAVSRFISPVGATKKLAGSLFDDNFSQLLTSTVISVVGKEWAVLCYEKAKQRNLITSNLA